MRPYRPQASGWRAIIAVVALYGFLLQPFLTAMARGADPAGVGMLCSPDGTGDPAHHATPAHDHGCCVAGHLAAPVLPPALDGVAVTWPTRSVGAVSWRPEAERPKTGPPTRAYAPRGPPSA